MLNLERELRKYKVADIEVRDRAREELGDINGMIQNIREVGLLQPLCVTEEDVSAPYKVRLIAGGRRLRAITLLVQSKELLDNIPCLMFTNVTEHTYKWIELSENLFRKAFTMREEVRLKAQVYKLGQEIYGKADGSGKGFSMTDAATLLGMSQSNLSKDITTNKQLRALESVGVDTSQIKSKDDVKKLVKNLTKTAVRNIAVNKINTNHGTLEGKLKNVLSSYIIGDCLEGMKKLPLGTFNFAEIDPPYAIELQKNKKSFSSNYALYNEVDVAEYPAFMHAMLNTVYDRLANNSFAILWHSDKWAPMLAFIAKGGSLKGATAIADCLINDRSIDAVDLHYEGPLFSDVRFGYWVKPSGASMRPEENLAMCHESFMILKKGRPLLNMPGAGNTFIFNPVQPNVKVHPTERPADMIAKILAIFCKAGSNVLVPFAGSGRTLIEAYKMSMTGVGFDLTPQYRDSFIVAANKEIK